jgi:hypothetical protein
LLIELSASNLAADQFRESLVLEKQSCGLYSVKTFGGPKDWVSKFGGPTQILALQIGGPKNWVSKFGGATQILEGQKNWVSKFGRAIQILRAKKIAPFLGQNRFGGVLASKKNLCSDTSPFRKRFFSAYPPKS